VWSSGFQQGDQDPHEYMKIYSVLGGAAQACNSSTWEAEADCEFRASLNHLKKKKLTQGWGYSFTAECLPCMHKALGQFLALQGKN
jgi:hypothetical protein